MPMLRAFYSDPHYGHANSIKYCDRPFVDVEDMNEKMAALYNEVIGPDDDCLWMGDCFFGAMHKVPNAQALLARLNGRKWLTLGNHDHKRHEFYLKLGFSGVFDKGIYLQMGSRVVYVNHYPASAFHPGDDKYQDRFPIVPEGVVLMHGHTHEKLRVTEHNALHAGVDAWSYKPATWDEMVALAESIPPEGSKINQEALLRKRKEHAEKQAAAETM